MPACGQSARTALDGNSLPVAVYVLAWHGSVFERETNVVGHEEIEMAVAVVVEKSTTRTPAGLFVQQSGGLGHVGEGAVSVVAVQTVLSEVGAKNIFEAIVVVIANADSGSPAHGFESGLFGDVGKRSIAVIFVETVGGFGRVATQSSSREDEHVHPAVVVVVEKSAAAAGGFEDVFLGVDTAVDDGSF